MNYFFELCGITTPKINNILLKSQYALCEGQTVNSRNEPAVENGVAFLLVQKSKQSGYENEEEISVRNNNNSGKLHNKHSTLLAACLPTVH